MRLSGDKIAIIIDEYGGLSGVMTLKKLLEEVVGDFGEEGTKPEEELIEIDTNTFNIDGGMSIQDLNEEFEDINIKKKIFIIKFPFLLILLKTISSSSFASFP